MCISSNEISHTQEQIIQVLSVCVAFIVDVTEQGEGCLVAHVTKGTAIQNLKAREPQRIFLYTGENMKKFFVSGGKVSATHLYKKNCTDSLL